jgi:hypothetical protein
MKTGKPREAEGVNAEPRMRIKSAHPHRFCASRNSLFTLMVTSG